MVLSHDPEAKIVHLVRKLLLQLNQWPLKSVQQVATYDPPQTDGAIT
jgi:hypothetical protein